MRRFGWLWFTLLWMACQTAEVHPAPLPTVAQVVVLPPPTPLVTQQPIVSRQTEPPVLTPTNFPLPTPTLAPSATPPMPLTIGLSPRLPNFLVEQVEALIATQPTLFALLTDSADYDLWLDVDAGTPLAQWLYVLVAPFPTLTDNISFTELQNNPEQLGKPISQWQSPEALATTLWAERPAYAIIPFEELRPDLKVLQIDGQSPLDPSFRPELYPLFRTIGITGEETAVQTLLAVWETPNSNYDSQQFLRVAMTGVSAPGRAVAAFGIEPYYPAYPGEQVAPILQTVDIAHISQEIPFATDCPPEEQQSIGDTLFCIPDHYLELFTSIGTDVVELTGNHINDWGEKNLQHTLDLYESVNIRTFGGGRNLTQAQQPLLWEQNGNKIAFVGCNPVGPAYAWAGESTAGSLDCGDYSDMRQKIAQLTADGYQVIATLQYQEYYQYASTQPQQADFRQLAEVGAVGVSGSQGHHAQGFEFYNGAFIHYGLGNLFFDQMDMLGTRQTFIDLYVFYGNRLIGVQLWTGLIENYCCPRPMTPIEREQLLDTVFRASGW